MSAAAVRTGERWSAGEIAVIAAEYQRADIATIAARLGRTTAAVRWQAASLGVSRRHLGAQGEPASLFGLTLRRYRLRAGLSQNALAKIVGINASYINRLESGEREEPTREVARALARALRLATEETDRLLFAAGHVPPTLQKLGPSDSTVAAVTRLLTNDRLSPEARADFRAVVEVIAERWMCSDMAGRVAGRKG